MADENNVALEVAYRKVFGRDEWKFLDFQTWELYNQSTGLEVLTPAWFTFLGRLGIELIVKENANFPTYKVVKK